MSRPFDPAPRTLLHRPSLLAATLAAALASVIAGACGSAAPTTSPEAAVPTPSAATVIASPGVTAAATIAPAATLAPAITAPPSAPPVTEPPVTPPPPTAAPGIGVRLQIGEQQHMTVLAAEQWPGTTTVKPAKGRVFYTVSVQIDAILLTSFDSADFRLRDASGNGYSWRPGRAPHLYDLANMTTGATYTGWITYEIPKTALGQFTLVYRPSFQPGATYLVPLF